MKRIVYRSGPPALTAGEAGAFECGVPRDVEDHLADLLLARADIEFREERPSPKKKEEVDNA